MERLTTVLKDTVYYAKGKWPPTTLCSEMETWEIRDCMTRLAQYENTGLSPEQVLELKERQIPQKPREHYHWGDFTKEEKLENNQWFCGKCGWQIGEEDNYCNECGQKVDWS